MEVGMIRSMVVAMMALSVSACSMSPKDLSRFGDVELDGSNLSSISITKPRATAGDKLPMCTASTVKNDSVSLSDTSGSFVGSYTGTYYRGEKNVQVGGGSVIQYISPDQSKIVAKGATGYTSAMIERSVRYTLTVQPSANGGRTYKFSGIQQAQLSTGSSANTGYFNVHTMMGGGSEEVASSLRSVADQIESCTL
jgi:hypothetical protein